MPHSLHPLAAMAHPDGGWGYVADQPSHLEPTCLALLALRPEADRFSAAVTSGRSFLRSCRRPDGSYRLARGRDAAVWGTALALFTEAAYRTGDVPGTDEAATAAVLLGISGQVVKADPEVADMCDIDVTLAGWPWGEGTFSWVEPTSWACLALHRLGQGEHPRVREGERLLLDRAVRRGRRQLWQSHDPRPNDRTDPRTDRAHVVSLAWLSKRAAGSGCRSVPVRAARH